MNNPNLPDNMQSITDKSLPWNQDDEPEYTCRMCGSSMTVRDTAHGEVIDCDNDNQECNYQVDKED